MSDAPFAPPPFKPDEALQRARRDLRELGLAEREGVFERRGQAIARVAIDGAAGALRENEDVKEFYLGVGGGHRKSFRDIKSYKRRKRWLS